MKNLTYKGIFSYEAIGEDIMEVESIPCKAQPDVGSGCSDWYQFINKEEEEEVHSNKKHHQ